MLDELARERGTSRSALVGELASEAQRRRTEAIMAKGYQAMAEENRRLAEQGLSAAADVMLRGR